MGQFSTDVDIYLDAGPKTGAGQDHPVHPGVDAGVVDGQGPLHDVAEQCILRALALNPGCCAPNRECVASFLRRQIERWRHAGRDVTLMSFLLSGQDRL